MKIKVVQIWPGQGYEFYVLDDKGQIWVYGTTFKSTEGGLAGQTGWILKTELPEDNHKEV